MLVSTGCQIFTEGEYAVGPSITYQEEENRMKSTSSIECPEARSTAIQLCAFAARIRRPVKILQIRAFLKKDECRPNSDKYHHFYFLYFVMLITLFALHGF